MVDAGAGANFRIVSVDEFALGALSVTQSDGSALPLTQPDSTTAGFDTAVLTYTATAPAGATTVTVAATAATAVANIASVQYAVGDPSTATFTDSGTLTVVAEDNIITVRVANEDDTTTRDYTITLTVPAPLLITSDSPTVTRVTSNSGTYNAGDRFVSILVHFSEPVTVTGTPQLALNGVGTTRFLRVVRGNELLFRYTFADNDIIARLAYTGTDALTLPDGVTIKNAAATLDADPTLPVPGDDNSLSGSSNVVIDTTPPTVDSVTYYSDEAATTEIDAADIGDTVYAVVQFSENIDNVLTVMDTNLGDGIDENIYGQPVLSARIPSSLPGSNFLPLPIIAHDAAFPPNNDRCRATSATNTSRYVCQIPLSLLVPGSVQIRVQAVGLTPSTPDGQTAVTRDLAGNQLAADYLDSDGITANVPAAPTVDSVTHYPTAARTAEISGDVVSGDIYSLIQFTGAAIRLLPAARLQIFYQIGMDPAPRVQFSYQHDAAVGVPAPGACRPFTTSTKENVNDPQFWCRYATQPGDTGQYQIIVGTGTEDIHDQALDPEYTGDTGVNLDVVDDAAAALTMDDVSVTEGDGPASITVTLDTAVTSGFTVEVSTADGIAVAPDDYIALTAHTLTFAGTADETQTFSVTIINDAITENEQGEPLTLALGNIVLPPGITTEIAIDTATLTITDNDNDISALTVENVSVGEGEGAAVVSVALDRETYTGFTVLIDTILGTAIGGQDYTTLDEHRLHFIGAAGETQTFSVTITDDNIAEPDETLTVPIVGLLIDPIDGVFTPEFNAATNLNVPAAATITIVDNDKLTFDGAIPDQTWVVGVPVALTLPEATGGNGMPRYTLTGTLPDGITAANNANAAAPTTLTGMPMAVTASATALTYTVTDSDPTNPVLPIALTFSATVRAAGDATLTALSVTPFQRPPLTLDPPFAAGITTYTAAVPLLNTTTVTVRGTFSDNDATLQCATGATPADDDFTPAAPDGGCPLIIDAGDTVLTARVTAADDITIRDYTITVTLDTLDTTPPTVESVTYYADKAATTEIAGGADVLIGTTVYAAIQFSESVENTVTREGVNGRPVIYLRHAGYIPSRPFEEVPHVIIAPGAAFLPNAAQCRATPATDTNRYLCQVTLLSGVVAVGPVQMGVRAQGLSTPFAVTRDLAGNMLAADYLAADAPGIMAITQDPPTVTAVTHYPTSATFATSGTISGTVVSGDIYTRIEFTGAAILRNDDDAPAARPQIFYQIDAAARVQFEYEFGTGVPAPGTCHLFTTGGAIEANDPQFLCRYATSPGDTGQYKIIVGAGTLDIYNQPTPEYISAPVTLDVVSGAAALTFSTNVDNVIEVSEGAGAAAITVTLSAAVTSGFTVDVSTADGIAVAPGDYTALTTGHTLTFAGTADETQTFSVTIIDDQITENEQGEPLTLTLGNVQGIATTEITIDTATLLIRDNDTSILTIDDVSVGEGGGTAEVTVQLEKAFYTGFTVLIDTIDATAISDQDYTSLDDHRLEFTGAAGETHTFSVTITDDAMVEFEETLTVEIDNAFLDPVDGISGDIVPGNLDITDTATITIVDNELSFGGTLDNQTWVVGVPVALTLPTATGGNDEPRYTLTGNLPDGVVAANNANAAAPTTLTGTPMAVTDSATLTYTVTDSDQTAPVTSIALTFSAAVRAAGTDATLNALSVMLSDDTDLPLTPAFAAGTFAYTATAPSATTTVTVAAPANDGNATVAIAGTDASGTALGVTGGDVFGLTTGDNIITVTVTAEDRSTQDYTITLTVPSADATLLELSVTPSGGSTLTFTPAFAASVFTYTATAPSATTTVAVAAPANDGNANVDIAVTDADGTALTVDPATGVVSGLTTGDNVITVTVTAEDDTTMQAYTITLTVPSADATLRELSVMPSGGMALTLTHSDGTTTDFATGQFTYTARAPAGTTTVTVTADTTDDGADVDIAVTDADGTDLTVDPATGEVSGLTVGDNVITVTVTAEDDTTMQAYTITLTVPSADATLRALSITSNLNRASPLPLSPAFDTETTAYTLEFPTGARTMYMNATPTSSAASVRYTVSNKEEMASNFREANSFTISFNGTSLINDRLTVRVIAEDGTTQDYIVRMTIRATASTDADLSDLTVTSDGTAVTLAPTFDAGTFAYTATAPSGTTSVTVAATVADLVGASVQYAVGDSPADAAFVDSGTLNVATGTNVLTARVTAEDDSTQDYTITLTVPATASTDATLNALTVTPSGGSAVTLTPVFDAATYTYTATVPAGTTTVTVDATANDIGATGVAIAGTDADGTALTVGPTTGVVSGLTTGDNTITVTVTAADGTTMRAYTITLTVQATVAPPPISLIIHGNGGILDTLDTTTPLDFNDVLNFLITVSNPRDADVSLVSTNGLFSVPFSGPHDSLPTDSFMRYRYNIRAPGEPADIPPGYPVSGGVYTDTIVVTASAPGRNDAIESFTLSVRQEVGLTNFNAVDTSFDDFGNAARTVSFNVDPDTTTIAIDHNDVFTIAETDTTSETRAFTVAPLTYAPTNDDGSARMDTITVTASDPAGVRQPVSHRLTFTIGEPVVITNLPTAGAALLYDGPAQTFDFSVEPADATVTATLALFSPGAVSVDPAASGIAGEYTLTVTPPTLTPTSTGGTTGVGVDFSVTATGRVPFTSLINFLVMPAVVISGLPTGAQTTLDYGAAATEFELTVTPATAHETGILTVTSTGAVTAEIIDTGFYPNRLGTGRYRLSVAPPSTGTNYNGTVTITATADGHTTFMQDIPFTIVDATLSVLSVTPSGGMALTLTQSDGTNTDFDTNVLTYTARALAGTTTVAVVATTNDGAATYTITGTAADGNTALGVTSTTTGGDVSGLTTGDNTITVTVTAADGSTMRDYTITLTVPVSLSNDATLRALSIKPHFRANIVALPLTPAFAAEITAYIAESHTRTTVIRVAAEATSSAASVQYAATDNNPTIGNFRDSGNFNINFLSTPRVTVRVTAEDGTTKDYTVRLTIRATASTDADLNDLTVTTSDGTGLTLTQSGGTTTGFATTALAYTATASVGTTSVTVDATMNDLVGASVQYAVGDSPADADFDDSGTLTVATGTNVLTARVTAEDDTTRRDYTITLTVLSADATLGALSISPNLNQASPLPLSPAFAAGTFAYTATASVGTTTVAVTATTNDGAATYTITGTDAGGTDLGVTSTTTGGDVTGLTVGDNDITVTVTAADGSTMRDYTITLTVQADPATDSAQQRQDVPSHWELIPDRDGVTGLDFGPGESFRLLFITQERRNAASPDIAVYNAFVQDVASRAEGDGLPIAEFSAKFRALISTPTLDARDNTGTNPDNDSYADAPIYWLNGARVADNYTDFYNGEWKREGTESRVARLRNEDGVTHVSPDVDGEPIWTGSIPDGTKGPVPGGFASRPASNLNVGIGRPGHVNSGREIRADVVSELTNGAMRPLYALSPVFTVQGTGAVATLDALTVTPSGGMALTLTQSDGTTDFAPAELTYTATAPPGTLTVTVAATVTDPNAGVRYAVGATPAIADFTTDAALPVVVGLNVLTVRVTSGDTTETRDYTITLNVPVDPVTIATGQQTQNVPTNWGLIPDRDGDNVPDFGHGQSFRLLFITQDGRDAISSDIADYNAFVQIAANGATGDGRPIAEYSNKFRALISTRALNSNAAVDARDNTGTNNDTGSDADAPIYWLNGAKLADDYMDFYNGDWDRPGSETPHERLRNQHGVQRGDSFGATGITIWTGSNNNGTRHLSNPAGSTFVQSGRPANDRTNPLYTELSGIFSPRATIRSVYALSPLFTVQGMGDDATLNALSVTTTGDMALTLTQSDGTTTGFDTDALTYTATAPAGTTTVTVDATATDTANAIVRYAVGATPVDADFIVGSTLNVVDGLNVLTVRVTSGDTSQTREYTITLTVPATAGLLTFGTATIGAQTYTFNSPIAALTLPEADGGVDPLAYNLVPLPSGLTFSTARVLTGTPTAAAAAAALTYTVTDNDSPASMAALTFTVTVDKADQPALTFANTMVQQVTADLTFTQTPTGGAGSGALTYTSSMTAVATVDSNTGEVAIVGIGTTTITATKAGDANYNEITASYTLTVMQASVELSFGTATIGAQTYTFDTAIAALTLPEADGGVGALAYTLAPLPSGLTFSTARVLTGTPTAAAAAAALTYTVTDNDSPASMAALTFTVTVDKADQPALTFANTMVQQVTADLTFTQTPTGGAGSGALTYTSSMTAVATVDSNTGEVAIVGIGTTTITATKAGDANYNEITASYTLTVMQASVELSFGTATIGAQTYTFDTAIAALTLPEADGGVGALAYTLAPLPSGLTFSTARVLTGTPTAAAAAAALTYTVTDSATPTPVTAALTFTVTVDKADQPALTFANTMVQQVTADLTFTQTPTGGAGSGALTYTSSMTAVATVDSNTGEVAIVGIGTTTITATKAGDANYNEITASYTLTVMQASVELSFGTATIGAQTYTFDTAIAALTLPPSMGGVGGISYTLAPLPPPFGLMFNATTRVLSGIPTAAGAAAALTYTVTDSATPTPATAALTFTVTVDKADQPALTFSSAAVQKMATDSAFTETPTGGAGSGAVTYTSSDLTVATVDSDTGLVTIVGIGTTTITATKAGDTNYNEITASYTLTVMQASVELSFGAATIGAQTYTFNTPIAALTLPGAGGGIAPLAYTLAPLPSGLTFSTARVLSGTPTAAATAAALTYTVTDSAATASMAALTFTVTVDKADQAALTFGVTDVQKTDTDPAFTETATGGTGTGVLTYTSSDSTVATVVSDTGEVTIAGIGTTTITATKAGDTNYNEINASYTLTVSGTVMVSTDATLSALTVTPTGGTMLTLTPVFDAATTAYTTTAPSATTTVTVAADTTDDGATVAIAGTAADGSTALGINGSVVSGLTAGDNVITVTVTAEDTTTTQAYTITLTVPLTDDVQVQTASLNEKILTRASQSIIAGTLAAVATRVEGATGFRVDDVAGDRVPKSGISAKTGGGGSPTPTYQLGGQSSLRGLLQTHGQAMLQDEMNYTQLLDGASFAMPLSAAGQSAGQPVGLSLWGSSDYHNLNSNEDDLDWDGQILRAHLGMDALVGEEVLVGLALSWHHAEFDYDDKTDGADSSGEYQYRTTNIHPYFGWLPNDDTKIWGTAGYGRGEIEITETGGDARSTDTAQLSLAGGFSNRILRAPGLLPGSVTTLNLKSDVSVARVEVGENEEEQFAAQNIDSRHLRLLVSGEQRIGLAGGGSLAPSLEVGVRFDSGDSTSGSGIETGTGLHYANPGGNLTLAGNIRAMRLDDYDEWGADIMFQLSPPGGRGLSFRMHPVWGRTQSTAEQLWDEGADELGGVDAALQRSLVTEVGYGVPASMLGTAGVLTPFVGMSVEDSGSNRVRLGGRFSGGDGLSLDLEGVQRNTADSVNHTVLLRGELVF